MEQARGFKKFMKHANRGLLLGALVIVIMTTYVIIDNAHFKKSRDELKEKSANFYLELFGVNEELKDAEIGSKIDEETQKKMIARLDDVLSRYCTEPVGNTNSLYSGYFNYDSNEDIRNSLAKWLTVYGEKAEFRFKGAKIKSGSMSDRNYQIVKQGPGFAEVNISNITIEVTYETNVSVRCMFPMMDGYAVDYDYYSKEEFGEETEPAEITTVVEELTMYGAIEFHDVDGEWKIMYSGIYLNPRGGYIVYDYAE